MLPVVIVVVVATRPLLRDGGMAGDHRADLRSWATPQGLDQRSYRDKEPPKSEQCKEFIAGQCRTRKPVCQRILMRQYASSPRKEKGGYER